MPYSGSVNQVIVYARTEMIRLHTPITTLRPAIGELSKSCGFHHGRIVAAIVLPRNVTAMTSVASSVSARKSAENA